MSHQRETADTLFDLLARRPVSRARLQRAQAWFASAGTPMDTASFMAYVEALQRALPAGSRLAALADEWRGARRQSGGFSEDDAREFLQDYTANLDPNLLFQAPITADYARWASARLESGFAFASESQQSFSLLCCDRGGARLRAGGRDLPLLPGRVLLVAPGALYSLQPLRGRTDWGYAWAVFQPDSRWRDWLDWPQFAPHIGHLDLPGAEQARVMALFRDLEASLQPGRRCGAELAHNLLEQLILRCRASLPAGFQPRRDARIERARAFVEAHYADAFTLADVARAANVSASRLANLFRAQCGLSVLGYRDELRMVQAGRLLRTTPLGIAEVGARVGYSDPAYFSRTFSRHVGVSPRTYRNQA